MKLPALYGMLFEEAWYSLNWLIESLTPEHTPLALWPFPSSGANADASDFYKYVILALYVP